MAQVLSITLPKMAAASDRQASERVRADLDTSPATRLATAGQKGRALWIAGAVALITAVFMPTAGAQLLRISAFLPAYQTAVIIAYAITAYLIFAHFRATRSLALLWLSGGCLYTAAILVAQFMTVPGMFLPQGPLFGGAQATIWLWCFWHAGPSAGIFLYVVSEWLWPNCVVDVPRRAARWFGAVLVVVFSASIAAITIFHDFLPVLDIDGNFHRITTTGVAPAIQVLTAAALLLLWRATGFRTVLQVWLGVAVFALLCDNTITMLGGNRLSVGWYVGRLNALISATTIMLVYLAEINRAYLKSVVDAKQLATSYAQLEVKADEARIDHLTGLAGRALFLEQAEALRAHSAANNLATAVLFVDLDGFKAINDEFGHDCGDTVLAQTADVLRASLRETDIAGRVGGDEFVVYLAAPSEFIEKTATAIAGRIVKKVLEIGNGIGCSVGITLSSGEIVDVETAIRRADEAMYAAKKCGKNRFVIHGQTHLAAVA
jgi:diguanylate cyclase (GGDEF)-like protein